VCSSDLVEWKQISHARVIAETKLADREVDPSQGTHFFQNITSLGVGYLTFAAQTRAESGDSFVDTDWLDAQPAAFESATIRHVRFAAPMTIYLDGRRGRATLLKPGSTLSKAMADDDDAGGET
jgi:hypothetical protein